MGIDWQTTAGMAAAELRSATESAVAMIEARCRNIAALEADNERLRTKNAELKALVAVLEESNRTAAAHVAELERRYARVPPGLHIAALQKRVAELEAERDKLRGARGFGGRDQFTLEREARIEEAWRRRFRDLELETEVEIALRRRNSGMKAARSARRRSPLPGEPGYVDPFWPKEWAAEWAGVTHGRH